jgi:4-diphosphocytidyl-2C-methyl-D-erythritol kinase
LTKLKVICLSEGADGAAVQLSGSGPTVFAYIPEGEKAAERVYSRAKEEFPGMFICITETF